MRNLISAESEAPVIYCKGCGHEINTRTVCPTCNLPLCSEACAVAHQKYAHQKHPLERLAIISMQVALVSALLFLCWFLLSVALGFPFGFQ